MTKIKTILILLNLALLLVYFNGSILAKETILENETLILLELAPVDPRSLMQGDYMELRYAISREFDHKKTSKRGYCVLQLDSVRVATLKRLQEEQTPLNANEHLVKYTLNKWSLNIGAESFFFQEGQAEKYDKAKYGGLKVDGQGNSVLIGLYDENRKLIK
jgi:uncharacterized membrane-anchored protein